MAFSLKDLNQKEQSEKAFKDAKNTVFTKAVNIFKENYATIAGVLNLKQGVNFQEITNMTKEAISGSEGQNQRGFHAKDLKGNDRFVTLDELDKKLGESPAIQEFLKSQNVSKISQLIPNKNQIDLLAGAVRDAVHEQLSPTSVVTTSAAAATSRTFAALKDGAATLFSTAITQASTNDPTEIAVKKAFAEKVQNSTINNLRKTAVEHPDLKFMLTEQRILEVGSTVYSEIMHADNKQSAPARVASVSAAVPPEAGAVIPSVSTVVSAPTTGSNVASIKNENSRKGFNSKGKNGSGHATAPAAAAATAAAAAAAPAPAAATAPATAPAAAATAPAAAAPAAAAVAPPTAAAPAAPAAAAVAPPATAAAVAPPTAASPAAAVAPPTAASPAAAAVAPPTAAAPAAPAAAAVAPPTAAAPAAPPATAAAPAAPAAAAVAPPTAAAPAAPPATAAAVAPPTAAATAAPPATAAAVAPPTGVASPRNDDFQLRGDIEPSVPAASNTNVEAIRAGTAKTIYDKVLVQTKTKIDENIEAEKDKLRNGGWFDSIKGFFFKLLDLLGLGDLVASFFTPSKGDISQVSHQVASTVSETLTAKDFKHNGKTVPEMNPEELKEAMQTQVLDSLKKNKHNYSGFSDENISQIASGAGAALAEPKNFAQLRDETPQIIYSQTQTASLQNLVPDSKQTTRLVVADVTMVPENFTPGISQGLSTSTGVSAGRAG